MNIAVFATNISVDARHYVEVFFEELVRNGLECYLHHNIVFHHQFELPAQAKVWKSREDLLLIKPDYLITLGGDGTLLNAATYVRDSGIPILGINTGRLGFLANIARHEIKAAINDLVNANYHINERSLLDIEVVGSGQLEWPYALNEITVARKDTTSMITVHTWLDDEFLCSYWADGLIIATPTGSTGYNLSCGGPIIMPGTASFVITPVSPHNLNVRPFVIPNHRSITLRVESREANFLTSLDSRIESMPVATELRVKKADFTIKMVQTEQQKFTKTLREKLYWGKDFRN
ncbi:MAG: NAD kinase [Flavobacteriales bacterium]|nr:MAG: NAD kinase [Flavobacteriales bacterium]